MAEAYDVAVAPHCPLGPLALGACLQIAACTPNHAIQEISLGIHYNTGGHDLLNFCTNKEALTPGRRLSAGAGRAGARRRHRRGRGARGGQGPPPLAQPDVPHKDGSFADGELPAGAQWHLKRSNGSRQDLQRHCALHGVAPKRLTSSVSVDPHCGHSAVADGSAGRSRRPGAARGRARVIQSVVHGGNSTRSMCTSPKPALSSASRISILDRDRRRAAGVGRADQHPRRIVGDPADDAEVGDRQHRDFGIGHGLEHGHDRRFVDRASRPRP